MKSWATKNGNTAYMFIPIDVTFDLTHLQTNIAWDTNFVFKMSSEWILYNSSAIFHTVVLFLQTLEGARDVLHKPPLLLRLNPNQRFKGAHTRRFEVTTGVRWTRLRRRALNASNQILHSHDILLRYLKINDYMV